MEEHSSFYDCYFLVWDSVNDENKLILGGDLSTKLTSDHFLILQLADETNATTNELGKVPNDSWAICQDPADGKIYRVPGYELKAGGTFDNTKDPKVSVTLTSGTMYMTLGVHNYGEPIELTDNEGEVIGTIGLGETNSFTITEPGVYGFESDNLRLLRFMGSSGCRFTIDESVYTGAIEDMSSMFRGCNLFVQDLRWLDTSSAINMSSMFEGAELFNSEISKWTVKNVISMNRMFSGATSFNKDLSDWCLPEVAVSSATNKPFDFDTGSGFEGDDALHPIFADPTCTPYNPNPDTINPDTGDSGWTGGLDTIVVNTDQNHIDYGETVDVSRPGYKSRAYQIGGVLQPELTLVRGESYVFNRTHPSNLENTDVLDIYTGETSGVRFVTGVRLTTTPETIFTVPMGAPDVLWYQSKQSPRAKIGGKINIVDP